MQAPRVGLAAVASRRLSRRRSALVRAGVPAVVIAAVACGGCEAVAHQPSAACSAINQMPAVRAAIATDRSRNDDEALYTDLSRLASLENDAWEQAKGELGSFGLASVLGRAQADTKAYEKDVNRLFPGHLHLYRPTPAMLNSDQAKVSGDVSALVSKCPGPGKHGS